MKTAYASAPISHGMDGQVSAIASNGGTAKTTHIPLYLR